MVDDVVGAGGGCYENGVQAAFEVGGPSGPSGVGMLQAQRSPSLDISRIQQLSLGLRPGNLDGAGGAFCDSRLTGDSQCCLSYERSAALCAGWPNGPEAAGSGWCMAACTPPRGP